MTKVSVIVPVYNVEKYLKRCLDSLVNQTLKDIEIIVVNDGTKDQSQTIIDEYASKYDNVISLIKENGGLSSARNYGLRYVSGEYIGCIDSDDHIELDMYEKMYSKAKETDSDLVVCDLQYEWENNERSPMYMKGISDFEDYPYRKRVFLSPLFAWNKLYRKDFFINSGLTYPEGKWYEDIPVTVPMFALANKIEYVDEMFIHYIQRDTSIMGSKYNPKMYDIFYQMESIHNFYKTHDLLNEYYNEIEYLFLEHLTLYGAFRFLRTSEYINLCKKSFEVMNKYFPNYKKNKYINRFSLKNRIFIKTFNPLTVKLYHKILERKG